MRWATLTRSELEKERGDERDGTPIMISVRPVMSLRKPSTSLAGRNNRSSFVAASARLSHLSPIGGQVGPDYIFSLAVQLKNDFHLLR
jgi:hypothetical protein